MRLPILLVLLLAMACQQDQDLPASQPPRETTPKGRKAPPTAEQVATAGPSNADVEYVRAVFQPDGAWTFHVTVRHADVGWQDYADGWDVILPDGSVILPDLKLAYTRPLQHPHETEQPFTRSQSGVMVPDGVTTVNVRAHDLLAGWGGKEVTVDLTRKEGPGYVVVRK